MAEKVLALTEDGRITYCRANPDQRGKGTCKHIAHQEPGESVAAFNERVADKIAVDDYEEDNDQEEVVEENPISLSEIQEMKNKICEIAGRDDITLDNLKDVIASLPPDKQQEIMEIGFEAGQYFAFPITDEEYEEAEFATDIYFSNMGKYGIGAKESHISEIMDEIGETVEEKGAGYISNNYFKGLSDDEYWQLQYATRIASINKTVSVAAPGEIARNLFYGLSDTMMIEDCGNSSSNSILDCDFPGGFCECCARKSPGGSKMIDILKKGSGGDISKVKIGGLISTNLSEPITQSYLNAIHSANDPNANQHKVIVNTFNGFKNSPVLEKAITGKTTEERRRLLYEGLKESYENQGIDIDDWNLQAVAKKMTSYKRNPVTNRLEFVEPDEVCDIVSVKTIGNRDNIFKKAALGSAFKTFAKGGKYKVNPFDAFNDLMTGTE